MTDGSLSRSTWSTLLNDVDTTTFGELVAALEDYDRNLLPAEPEALVETAIADGPLVENPEAPGAFAEYQLADRDDPERDSEASNDDATPGIETTETADNGRKSGGTGVNPPDQATVREAFAETIQYFNRQLNAEIRHHTQAGEYPDRPTTARDYFTDRRGWDEQTLDDALLGWAPPHNGATDALVAAGYDRDTLLATGLFNRNLEPRWKGRYVLPYLNADGEPAYAIARCTGDDGGGAAGYDGHPADHMAGKYAKIAHTHDHVPLEEPIYGTDTLADGEPVLIAEGIADAITARERGWSVLSPVAKEFKRDHLPPLLDALEAHDVPHVTVVADNDPWEPGRVETTEPPHQRVTEAVSLPPAPPGIAGALRTADYLQAANVDVRVAVPPAPLGDGSDLDAYLHQYAETPAALVRSAKPPEAFPEYDAATRGTDTGGDWRTDTNDDDREEKNPADSGRRSALWELDLGDLLNADAGDRGTNPLGHTGESENYFVVREGRHGDLVGRDYKRGVVYNGLTYLLVEAGERLVSSPEGDLDDKEVWHAWKHAKNGHHLPAEDPVPYRGLVGVALDDDLVDQEDLESWEDGDGRKLPAGSYNTVLQQIREEHGLNPGREKAAPPEKGTTATRDLLELDVVVEPRNALAAAETVEPADLERDLPELQRADVDDVAIAVALAEGWIPDPDTFPSDGHYTEAYYRARDTYGAPLPKYLDNSTLEERENLVFAALDRITPEHVLDTCRSDVTVEDPAGTAIAKLNPIWEDSESGERILAGYGRGFYCVEHDVSFSPVQFVALEHDLYPDDLEGSAREHAYPRGEAFKTAYRLLREDYGAPLPKWRATLLEHVAVLPPSVRLLNDDITARADGYSLDEAREATEALLRDAVTVRDRAQLVTALPGTGKTYGTAALAADRPILYITQRNALKQQMAEYVATICDDQKHHPDAEPTTAHLPILAENTLPEPALLAGVAAVYEHDRDLLRDPETLYQHVADELKDRPEADE